MAADLTPAETLRAAATKLRAAADAAWDDLQTNPYWAPYDPDTVWHDGLVNGFGGAGAELAALFPPDVAAELASWLEHQASVMDAYARKTGTRPDGSEPWARPALAVARAVLGVAR